VRADAGEKKDDGSAKETTGPWMSRRHLSVVAEDGEGDHDS